MSVLKVTNKIVGQALVWDGEDKGTYKDYIRFNRVDFFPDELKDKIDNGRCFLITYKSIQKLSYIENDGVYTFASEKVFSKADKHKIDTAPFTLSNRFFLWNEEETEKFITALYKDFDFTPFKDIKADIDLDER